MRFRELAENIDDVFWLADAEHVYYVSPAFAKIWGRPVESVLGDIAKFFETIHPDDRASVRASFRPPERAESEYRVVRPDGELRWIRDRTFPVRDERGRFVRIVGIATDITPRKALEAELLQTQKLESLGRLAGGVAHDFNNLLTVILSQTRLAARAFASGRTATEELGQIEEAASRAVDLTRQLLTFARRQASHPTPLDLTEVTGGIEKLLRRVIGDDVDLVVRLDPHVGIIRADRAQIEQVLLNLAVNARDAMPAGGTLTIETRNVVRDGASAAPGPYVLLQVTDDGAGIAPEDVPHIFDPFFTTKAPGEGTGLGLATCYGIVQHHGGEIDVESVPGKGSSFHVYFPRIDARPESPTLPEIVSSPMLSGSETVLLVEDDALVRAAAAAALRGHGFAVVEASSGEDALGVLAREHVDVVVSDVVMRGLGGRELADRLKVERPDLPVLLTSGYAEDIGTTPFLPKPYVPATLVQRVRELLDR
jgi:PAS domain S-box-containing protein